MNDKEQAVLSAASAIGKAGAAQLKRFIFEVGLAKECDLSWTMANLREAGLLQQTVGSAGILYALTAQGEAALRADEAAQKMLQRAMESAEEYKSFFSKEEEYIAQYSEQATGVVPVFLSIRRKEKILFKVNVIVPDAATAEQIRKNWVENAQKTYEAAWESLAPGIPMPVFE